MLAYEDSRGPVRAQDRASRRTTGRSPANQPSRDAGAPVVTSKRTRSIAPIA
jgi:hypothetical protein